MALVFTPVYAEAAKTGTITIKEAEETDTFALYPILTFDEEDQTYTFTESFDTFLNGEMNITQYRLLEDNSEAYKSVLTRYAIYVRENNIEPVSTSQSSFTSVTAGQYLILGTSQEGYIFQPMSASLIETDTAEITVKKSRPVIQLSAEEHKYFISGTIPFTITATIPVYPKDSLHQTYIIQNTLEDGLEGYENLVVEASKSYPFANGETLLEDTHYTFTSEDNTFTMTFDYETIASYQSIQVHYNSVLSDSAPVTQGVTDTAVLQYSIDPYGKDDTKKESKDTEKIYTYALDITKTDADALTPLEGVTFELYTDEACTTKICFKKDTDRYILDPNSKETPLITDASGHLKLYGLKDGTYYLKETETLDHYQLPSVPFTITITDDNANGLIEKDKLDTDSGILTQTITNTLRTNVLPETGSTGTILFSFIGLTGMSFITILLAYLRKRS